jgi:retron-type reverse transcriptase
VIAWENLALAARKAQRGKRYRDNVLEFNDNLEDELLTLQEELNNHTYSPGPYRTFQKERLSGAQYVRYVDDFALFSDDRDLLLDARPEIESVLACLRLKIHPVKSQLFETRKGPGFVGFRILPDRMRVRAENLRRGRRRLRRYQKEYAHGKLGQGKLTECIRSWIAHLAHGQTWWLRERIFASLAFTLGASARA